MAEAGESSSEEEQGSSSEEEEEEESSEEEEGDTGLEDAESQPEDDPTPDKLGTGKVVPDVQESTEGIFTSKPAVKGKEKNDSDGSEESDDEGDESDDDSDSDSDTNDGASADDDSEQSAKRKKNKKGETDPKTCCEKCCAIITYYTLLGNLLICASALYSLVLFPLLLLRGSLTVISEFERAMIFRAGKSRFGQKVVGPGAYWLLPFVDRVRKVDIRRQAITFTTKIRAVDRKWFMIDWLIFVKIGDPLSAILNSKSPKRSTKEMALGVCRSVASGRDAEEICEERKEICSEIEKQLGEKVSSQWGVNIECVEMQDVQRILDPRKRKKRKEKKYKAGAGKVGVYGELPDLPAPWQALKDPSSGQTYYHNVNTGRTQWSSPA